MSDSQSAYSQNSLQSRRGGGHVFRLPRVYEPSWSHSNIEQSTAVNDEAQNAMSPGQYFTPREDNVCSFSAATCSYSQSHQHSTVRHTGRV